MKSVSYKIFCSPKEEPYTVHDGKVIGSMNIVFDDDLENNEIVSKFTFSETLLKVEAWPKDHPNHVRIVHNKTREKVWHPLEDQGELLYPEIGLGKRWMRRERR